MDRRKAYYQMADSSQEGPSALPPIKPPNLLAGFRNGPTIDARHPPKHSQRRNASQVARSASLPYQAFQFFTQMQLIRPISRVELEVAYSVVPIEDMCAELRLRTENLLTQGILIARSR